MEKELEMLKAQVKSVMLDDKIFEVRFGEDRIVFGAIKNKDGEKEPDLFSFKTIYESIYDAHLKINLSFYSACEYNLIELSKKHSFIKPRDEDEKMAEYFIENMAFRVSILWDLLAQLYNELWQINIPIDKLYYSRFFNNEAEKEPCNFIAKRIHDYLIEEDDTTDDTKHWKGNHTYLVDYRDKMTHRNSPNISTISGFDRNLRLPAIFSLKRITEDYLQVLEYIQEAVDEIRKYIESRGGELCL